MNRTARQQAGRRSWGGRRPKDWFPINKGLPIQVLLKQRMTELGAQLDGGMELSMHEVAARSGGLVSANTVSLIIRGQIGQPYRPTEDTIEGLARALEVDPEVVRRAAETSVSRPATIELPKRAAKLSDEQWAEVIRFMDYLLTKDNK